MEHWEDERFQSELKAKAISCPKCPKQFLLAKACRDHIRSTHVSKPFGRLDYVQKHVRNVHGEADSRRLIGKFEGDGRTVISVDEALRLIDMFPNMELNVWAGDWGLPSVDHDCLAAMAYSRFSAAPVHFRKLKNPIFNSPTRTFPCLVHEDTVVAESYSIALHLRQQRYNADFNLSEKQEAETIAFQNLIQEQLSPALDYLWWCDPESLSQVTRPWYASALPIPLSWILPAMWQRSNMERLKVLASVERSHSDVLPNDPQTPGQDMAEMTMHSVRNNDGKNSVLETEIFRRALEAMNVLSLKLGNKEFFFGKTPTFIDALLFSVLAPLLKVPFPNKYVTSQLKGYTNLVDYVERILKKYFPLTYEERREQEEREKRRKNRENSSGGEADDFPHAKRNLVLAVVTAAVGLIGFSILTGSLSRGRNSQYSSRPRRRFR
ncbi:unnamed protein product [Cyprideis torosa]|uniref:Uncharacterized protein n=1 Tax=Cyprideis torosa TaxID=163714 RepID=A0A7R8WBM5_9CRUS|nr:unnamed protein product [Cyprideis torosa]CAG0886487.1 unnamed protein product [Cyprideis torosa]